MYVFSFSVILIGKWSDDNALRVCQVVFLFMLLDTVVMCGDVFCSSFVMGCLVCVFVFSI